MSVKQMVLRAINKYKDHPSVKVISQHSTSNGNSFRFCHVSPNEVMTYLTRIYPTVGIFRLVC